MYCPVETSTSLADPADMIELRVLLYKLIITEPESVHAWIEEDGAYIHVECIQKVYWLSRVLPAYNKAAAW